MRSRDRDHPGQHGETPSLLKILKISWAWWHVPVIPATQEAEAGELLEPRRKERSQGSPLGFWLQKLVGDAIYWYGEKWGGGGGTGLGRKSGILFLDI